MSQYAAPTSGALRRELGGSEVMSWSAGQVGAEPRLGLASRGSVS